MKVFLLSFEAWLSLQAQSAPPLAIKVVDPNPPLKPAFKSAALGEKKPVIISCILGPLMLGVM